MSNNVNHWAAIDDFFCLGKKLGYIPIKEYSFLNLVEDNEQRIDLVWLDNKGEPKYFFEFEVSTGKQNYNKVWHLLELIPNLRSVQFFQFKVYDCLKGTKIKLMHTNFPSPESFLKMIEDEADIEFFEKRGRITEKKVFDKKKKEIEDWELTDEEVEMYFPEEVKK